MTARLRILILGARGRLGHALHRHYQRQHDVTAWGRSDLNLLQLDTFRSRLDQIPFDALINAAGITNVDLCEVERETAEIANAAAPAQLAAYCARSGRRFIHISSDYVFAGTGKELLSEQSPAVPINHYGWTKLRGEQAVLSAFPEALVARVSWLFGRDKPSFPDTIVRNALRTDHISAVHDKWSSPTCADDLSNWLLVFLTTHRNTSGLIHLCNTGAPSWQEYGQYALQVADRMGLPLKTIKLHGHSMAGFEAFKATRPPFTALSTQRLTQATGILPRSWQQALEEHLHHVLRDPSWLQA